MKKELTQAELIEDFKQYVVLTVHNVVQESEERVMTKLGAQIDHLRSDISDGFQAIAKIFDQHQSQLDSHDKSIRTLESLAA